MAFSSRLADKENQVEEKSEEVYLPCLQDSWDIDSDLCRN
jgi:hypothetical protein